MPYETHLDMEIRKLRPAELCELGSILSISDSWKKLMSIVPKQGNASKFSSDHIRSRPTRILLTGHIRKTEDNSRLKANLKMVIPLRAGKYFAILAQLSSQN
ncbi:uncharacterized protein Tub isoform X3 [Temnothorax longispinosus]|uniref:uncharacterized protein Tub isoform X3 n=1 Tax=Temnothorax longispinosus TaxID=300112 RepID=UPI003A99A6F6